MGVPRAEFLRVTRAIDRKTQCVSVGRQRGKGCLHGNDVCSGRSNDLEKLPLTTWAYNTNETHKWIVETVERIQHPNRIRTDHVLYRAHKKAVKKWIYDYERSSGTTNSTTCIVGIKNVPLLIIKTNIFLNYKSFYNFY